MARNLGAVVDAPHVLGVVQVSSREGAAMMMPIKMAASLTRKAISCPPKGRREIGRGTLTTTAAARRPRNKLVLCCPSAICCLEGDKCI